MSERADESAPVVLVDAVREQLLDVADGVLGALEPDEVPAPLRPIARFTPSKRRRLGAPTLAAVLDNDAVFRDRVARAVTAASPELAEAVAAGAPPPTADPLDIAVVAYLTRPDGWRESVDAACRAWESEHGTRAGDGAELERLRDEVTRLRGTVRGEPARLKAAVADAVTALEDEVATLRRTIRDRTRELRTAERARAEAAEAADRAEPDVDTAAHESELEQLRGRISELEGELEAARTAGRRAARTERDVDTARLWLLVDTLVQAAGGVRRELSLPTPRLRPADAIGSAGRPAGGDLPDRSAGDAEALERLLALPNVHLVVDGYNVTKTGYPHLTLADQRARLIGALAALHGRTGAEVTVAFDGSTRPPVQPPAPRGVRVLFSAADEIADDLIRRLVAAEPEGRAVLVVTSDRQVVRDTAGAGVWAVPSAVLVARLG